MEYASSAAQSCKNQNINLNYKKDYLLNSNILKQP